MLQIFNSLTHRKEAFKPIKPKHVGLYVCGVTVYDYCHIGHARTYLTFDVIVRYLRWQGYSVKYVRNITDIDDKIIKRAAQNKEPISALAERFTQIMQQEFDALSMLRPDVEPRATQTIPQMIDMIQTLIAKDYAYQVESGDVLYRVAKFKDYGKLSGQDTAALRVGSRVAVDEHKQDALDFVLWKASKPDEPAWDSPWGAGRPGWHLECSCMTKMCLGDYFDIHGGGADLLFPHHENEIAQSEVANASPLAKYWVHAGMVRVNQLKMSKSLGNFFVIRDVLQQYSAEVVRYFLISAHYRSAINYTDDNLTAAKNALTTLYNALRGLDVSAASNQKLAIAHDQYQIYKAKFMAAMDDDFNTPEAIGVLFALAREMNRLKAIGEHESALIHGVILQQLGAVLGLLQQAPDQFLQGDKVQTDVAMIEQLITERDQARQTKDWHTADQVRDKLQAIGVELEDTAAGTIWRRV